MGRTPCCQKLGLKKGRWTAEEDEILTNYIQANGEGSWRSLPKNAGLLRCGKSCRLRWINYLRPDIKRGNMSVEDENTIVKLHAEFGNRWSLIASHMPGRTDNEIKNYWNSHLSRKIYSNRLTTNKAIMTLPPKRKGGRTSRWAMKKNKAQAQAQAQGENPEELTELEMETIMEFLNEDAIDGGEEVLLGFNEMDTCLTLSEASGVLISVSGEDTESNNDEVGTGKQRGDTVGSSQEQNLLTCLWEDEDWEKDLHTIGFQFGDIHHEILACFLDIDV